MFSKRMLTKAGFLLLLTLFLPRALWAQLPAGEILNKVSETYKSVQNYQFVAEKNVEVAAVGDARSLDGSRTSSNFNQFSNFEVALAATSAGKSRLSLKDQKQQTIVVNDASKTWTFLPAKKQFTEEPSGPPNVVSPTPDKVKSGVDLLIEYQNLLVNRFRSLSDYTASATLGKDERVKLGGEKRDCYHVRIQVGSGYHELWIDKESFLVLRNKDVTPTPQEGISLQTTVTVNLRTADRNPTFADDFFAFTPPEAARKVDSLKF